MKSKLRYIHTINDIILSNGDPYLIDEYNYEDSYTCEIIPCKKCGVPYFGKSLGTFPNKEKALAFLEGLEDGLEGKKL